MWHINNEGKQDVQDLLIDTLLTFLLLWRAMLFLWCKKPSLVVRKDFITWNTLPMHSILFHLCEEYWSVIVVVMSLTFFIAVLWYSDLDFWLKKWWECIIFQILLKSACTASVFSLSPPLVSRLWIGKRLAWIADKKLTQERHHTVWCCALQLKLKKKRRKGSLWLSLKWILDTLSPCFLGSG